MFEYLRRLAARIMNGPNPLSSPPGDPSASVREPRHRKPDGRSSAVAVAEPDPPTVVSAVASRADHS
jgi:hypothetical protein